MYIDLQKQLFIEAREYYKSIQKIYVEALESYVFFNESGFIHIMFKKRIPRNMNDRVRRYRLLRLVPEVLTDISCTLSAKTTVAGNRKVLFISIEKAYTHGKIKVIVRKIDAGSLHFFSVMDSRK